MEILRVLLIAIILITLTYTSIQLGKGHESLRIMDKMDLIVGTMDEYYEKLIKESVTNGDMASAVYYRGKIAGAHEMFLLYCKGEKGHMEYQKKIVKFETYCPRCEFESIKETDNPCNRCLNNPVNENSYKPIEFKEKHNGES